jgi:hypothetical protein
MSRLMVSVVLCLVMCNMCFAGSVLFDDAHMPANSVFERNPICPFTNGMRGGYHDLMIMLGSEGFVSQVMEPPLEFTESALLDRCLVVVNSPCQWGDCRSAYTTAEIATLYEYVLRGGNILMMAEPFLRSPVVPTLARFGFTLGDSIITHVNPMTYESSPENVLFDGGTHGDRNLGAHSVFDGVSEIVFYGSDYILPITLEALIRAEADGVPRWAAAGVISHRGNGKVIIAGDSDWPSGADRDGDGIKNLFERDNEILITNIVNWLCPSENGETFARTIGYWRHQCRGNGFTEISQDSLMALEQVIVASSFFFSECFDTSGCDLMLADPPNNDMLRKAAQQLYAVWLNYKSGKIPSAYAETFLVRGLNRVQGSNLDPVIAQIEGILCDPLSTHDDLEFAKDLAESINTAGHEEGSLNASTQVVTITPGEMVIIPTTVYNCSNSERTFALTATGDLDAWVTPAHITLPAEGFAQVDLKARVEDGSIDGVGLVTMRAVCSAGRASLEVVGADITGTAGVTGVEVPTIELRTLGNPSGAGCEIMLSLDRAGQVDLSIYDVTGRQLRNLVHGDVPAGTHYIGWDGRDETGSRAADGMYFARLTGYGFSHSAKIVLAR